MLANRILPHSEFANRSTLRRLLNNYHSFLVWRSHLVSELGTICPVSLLTSNKLIVCCLFSLFLPEIHGQPPAGRPQQSLHIHKHFSPFTVSALVHSWSVARRAASPPNLVGFHFFLELWEVVIFLSPARHLRALSQACIFVRRNFGTVALSLKIKAGLKRIRRVGKNQITRLQN